MAVDTLVEVETPEGIGLQLRAAGPVARAYAWVIDFAIRLVVMFLVLIPIGWLGELGVGIVLLVYFGLEWLYPLLFEALRGATPGKRALGLAVVHENGTPVGWTAATVRNLLRAADFFPVGYGVGLLWCLFHPRHQRLGDLAAGTLVVYREPASERVAMPRRAPRPLPVPLGDAEQQALLGFAERSQALAPERARELAELLRPLHHAEGDAAVEALLGYANQVAGR